MIRLPTLRVALVTQLVFLCIVSQALNRCVAEPENDAGAMLPLSPARVSMPGWTTGTIVYYSTIQWDGHEYSADEGTRVLMQVITNPATDGSLRAKALRVLGRLRNTDITPQLVSLYNDLREGEEKAGVIRCLMWSEDPRGLALFAKVLNHEHDNTVRFSAATALAQWNIRQGVAELVKLLESKEILSRPARLPYIRDNASDIFSANNRRKGWGFSEEEIRKSIEDKTEMNYEQKVVAYIAEIKKWFAENEHRFPDWKPGDPLPEVKPSTVQRK